MNDYHYFSGGEFFNVNSFFEWCVFFSIGMFTPSNQNYLISNDNKGE